MDDKERLSLFQHSCQEQFRWSQPQPKAFLLISKVKQPEFYKF